MNASVTACDSSVCLNSSAQMKTPSVAEVISNAKVTTLDRNHGERIADFGSRGGRPITSGSGGSMARASAGNTSVTRLSQRI
jgi:hypothetical protein